jgi:hypothetical protein
VFVAAGDFTGDGKAELLTGADAGGGPHVRVFNAQDGSVLYNFFAYDSQFFGGVRVAAGDVTGDGVSDIITGPGPGGGSHVRFFDGLTGLPVTNPPASYFAFPGDTRGVYVASHPPESVATPSFAAHVEHEQVLPDSPIDLEWLTLFRADDEDLLASAFTDGQFLDSLLSIE